MARIVIDARPIGTSTGRYLFKLVENLSRLDKQNSYTVLVWPDFDKAQLQLGSNFRLVDSPYSVSGSLGEQLGLLRQLRKLKPDLVHFGLAQQPILYKQNKLTTIHDLTTVRFDNPVKFKPVYKFKQLVYKLVIKSVAKNSRAIITPSQYVKKDVAKFAGINPAKIAVTYEAAERITAKPEPLPRLAGKKFIMYVGRANPHKNLARLVEAFRLLTEKHPDLYLVLAGQNDANYKRLGQLITDKRLAHSVILPGRVSEGELRWLYENTAAYVFPSLSEGFGLPPLEAMTHGAPVVSSNASCLPEINGEAALYFDPLSVEHIAAQVDKVLSSRNLRTSLVNKGHVQAARYSWKKMTSETLRIYRRLLEG